LALDFSTYNMYSKQILSFLGFGALSSATTLLTADQFENGEAVKNAAPLWLFPSDTCMPSPAYSGTPPNVTQTQGNDPDNCNIFKLDNNCPEQPENTGSYTEATKFPTYYMTSKCDDGTYRILYDVYYTKDTGHANDWEWIVLLFQPTSSDSSQYRRTDVWLEQDGDHPSAPWDDFETFSGANYTVSGKGFDRPKIYCAKFHHSTHSDSYTTAFEDTCPPDSDVDYRTDDYFYDSTNWLVDGTTVPKDWD